MLLCRRKHGGAHSASFSQRHLLLSPALLWLHLRGHRNHRIRVTSPLTCSCLSPHARDRWVWREAGLRGDPHAWWEGVQKAGAGTTGRGSRATQTLGEAGQAEGRASSKTGRWAAGWDQAEGTGGESWSEARGLAKGESRGPRSGCVSGRREWKAAHETLRAAQGATSSGVRGTEPEH